MCVSTRDWSNKAVPRTAAWVYSVGTHLAIWTLNAIMDTAQPPTTTPTVVHTVELAQGKSRQRIHVHECARLAQALDWQRESCVEQREPKLDLALTALAVKCLLQRASVVFPVPKTQAYITTTLHIFIVLQVISRTWAAQHVEVLRVEHVLAMATCRCARGGDASASSCRRGAAASNSTSSLL